MTEPTVHETHTRTARRIFDRHELMTMLGNAVAAEAGMPGAHDPAIKVKVEFQDQTEGSPAYKVGTKAIVTIEHDLLRDPPAPDRR